MDEGLIMADIQGLLSNPALQMGLGILASNNTDNFGVNLGRGGLLGMRNLQQQQLVGQRQQQMEMMAKMREAQAKELERRGQAAAKQQAAIDQAIKEHPEMANQFAIDPQGALDRLYPKPVTPHSVPVYTPDGAFGFDSRTSQLTPLINPNTGKQVVRASDSPMLQGQIQGAKSRAQGNYRINTDVDGVVTTDTGLADQIKAPQGGWQIPANVQQGRDKDRLSILEAEQQAMGGEGANPALDQEIANVRKQTGIRGISVPTKAELAAEVEKAKTNAEYNSPEATKKREMALNFKKTMGKNVIAKLDDVIGRVDGFSSGWTGKQLSNISGTDAYDLNADIETIKANFGFDRLQAMRDMSPTGGALGQVAVQELTALQASIANMDIGQSKDQLKKNLETAKKHYENWLETLDVNTSEQGDNQPIVGTGNFSVTAPNGKTYQFNTQREMNNFKMKANIR